MRESGKYSPEQVVEEAGGMNNKNEAGNVANNSGASDVVLGKELNCFEASVEYTQADIRHKSDMIRDWISAQGLVEGRDIRIIESIHDVETDAETITPDEENRLFVMVLENQYDAFKEFITGPYTEQRRRENPNNRHGGPRLDYSWGGRFAVGWDGATIDTAPVTSVEPMEASTHHQEFRQFYHHQTGEVFPTSDMINPVLREIGSRSLEAHIAARNALQTMRQEKKLPFGGENLLNELERTILIFQDAANGEAVTDLPETLGQGMPSHLRHYADLTYNAEHIQHLSDYEQIKTLTGIDIPSGNRLTDLFEKIRLDPAQVDAVCKDFSLSLSAKRALAQNRVQT